jgi:hypothetical protein
MSSLICEWVPLQTSREHTPIFELINKNNYLSCIKIIHVIEHSRREHEQEETIRTSVKGVRANCSQPKYGCIKQYGFKKGKQYIISTIKKVKTQ